MNPRIKGYDIDGLVTYRYGPYMALVVFVRSKTPAALCLGPVYCMFIPAWA